MEVYESDLMHDKEIILTPQEMAKYENYISKIKNAPDYITVQFYRKNLEQIWLLGRSRYLEMITDDSGK